jgi:phosphoribosylformimino-5-aminoimidazole carboxamide ribotide isomerase
MRIIPVMDVAQGVVVHARGGERANYQPIQSTLSSSADPIHIAQAFQSRLGLKEPYVADLDALTGDEPQWEVLARLVETGRGLLVDAGVRDVERAVRLARLGVQRIVVALECLREWSILERSLEALGPERIVFSLDLRGGRPMLAPGWRERIRDVHALTDGAVASGVRTLIVLDVADVGQGAGCSTLGLCQAIRKRHPGLAIITGGGVRQAGDLRAFREAGVSAALVATALHTGQITASDLA